MFSFRTFLITTLSFFTTSIATAACTYYIAPNGSDSASGSYASPWATINYASAKLSAGQTLCARGGTYYRQAGYIWHSSGTALAPVTFMNAPGEKPVFDGEWGDTGTEGDFLVFSGNAYVVVDGLTIQRFADQYGNGTIDLNNSKGPADHITIQNCTMIDNGSHTAQDHHIYLATGATNTTIRNNLFIRAAGSAIQSYHTPASSGIKIYNNVMIGGTLNCSQSKSNPCATTAKAHWGIIIGDGNDVQIYNNTIYGMQTGIEFNYGTYGGTSTNGPYVVKNNLIVNSSQAGIHIESPYALYVTSDYNGFSGNASDINWKGSNITLLQFSTSTTNDRHSFNGNPSFVNAGSDFHLSATSPFIDKGVPLSLFTVDKDWISRLSGSSYDIGAYEFASTTTPDPTPAPAPAPTAPVISLSTTSLSFTNQQVGTTSAIQYVTITNKGTAALKFTGIVGITGDFASGNTGTCTGNDYAPGASCTVSVVFKPTAVGVRSGTLSIFSNASIAAQTVALSGSGTYVDITAPITAITSPVSGSYVFVRSSVTIQANATDNVAVKSVQFYVNGSLKCTTSTAPYKCAWVVPRYRGKKYSIQTKAFDAAGNVGFSKTVSVTSK